MMQASFVKAAKVDVDQALIRVAAVERALPRDEAWARGLPTAAHNAVMALTRLRAKLHEKA